MRVSNTVAIRMYQRLGYTVYRRVLGYYGGGGAGDASEDALDMRKSLPRDGAARPSMEPLKAPVYPKDIRA